MKVSQTDILYDLLKDNKPHSTIEIMSKVYGDDHLGLARVGARIWDCQRKYKVKIKGWHDHDKRSIYWYQIETLATIPIEAQKFPQTSEWNPFNPKYAKPVKSPVMALQGQGQQAML
jgi:hypothetical protein